MDNIELFKIIEGKHINLQITSFGHIENVDMPVVRISMDGELMWDNYILTLDWNMATTIQQIDDEFIFNVGSIMYEIFLLES